MSEEQHHYILQTFVTILFAMCQYFLFVDAWGVYCFFGGMLVLRNSRQLQSILLGLRVHFDEVPFSHVATAGISHFHNNLDAVAIA